MKKIAVLVSGNGSNLEAIIRYIQVHQSYTIGCVITNNSLSRGILIAKEAGFATEILSHHDFSSREEFDNGLVQLLQRYDVDLVVLAGFMRIVTSVFTQNVKAINLHPSLLPLFKGKEAIKQSFESGMKVGGVTIHYVTDELDGGEIIAQACVSIQKEDTLESFTAKIHACEHLLLPQTIEQLLQENV